MSKELNIAAQSIGGEIGVTHEYERFSEVMAGMWSTMTQRTARLRGWRGSSSTGGAWESHSRTSSFDVDLLLADDDHITLVYRLSGTHKGEFMGHASTGKHFEVRSGRSIRERPDCPALAGPPTSLGLT